MMTHRSRNVILAAVLLAAGVLLTASYLRAQDERAAREQDLVEVLVATEPIVAGTPAADLLEGDLVELREVRSADVVDGALRDAGSLGDRAASATIWPGDQVASSKFVDESQLPATAQVTGTERLLSLPVGRFQRVDGTLRDGDRVDIWASRTVNNVTRTWVAGRDVLVSDAGTMPSTDSARSGTKRDFPVLTVRVSDAVAERLIWSFAHADESGLVLAARPAEGATQTRLTGLRTNHE